MKNVDIISGFLGSGKTTLIKKLLKECLQDENVVIIENEYGEVGIDGSVLRSDNIIIKEITSGCICCSISKDFRSAIKGIISTYNPDRIIIEPSGVAKLSQVVKEISSEVVNKNISINMKITVVDAVNFEQYIENFGEFFVDQIQYAKTVLLSKTEEISNSQLMQVFKAVRKLNPNCPIISTPIAKVNGDKILKTAEFRNKDLMEDAGIVRKTLNTSHVIRRMRSHSCADEVFDTWGVETPKCFAKREIKNILDKLKSTVYGNVIRAKGLVNTEDSWVQFDYVSGKYDINDVDYDYTGRICVIGTELKKQEIKKLFLGE